MTLHLACSRLWVVWLTPLERYSLRKLGKRALLTFKNSLPMLKKARIKRVKLTSNRYKCQLKYLRILSLTIKEAENSSMMLRVDGTIGGSRLTKINSIWPAPSDSPRNQQAPVIASQSQRCEAQITSLMSEIWTAKSDQNQSHDLLSKLYHLKSTLISRVKIITVHRSPRGGVTKNLGWAMQIRRIILLFMLKSSISSKNRWAGQPHQAKQIRHKEIRKMYY